MAVSIGAGFVGGVIVAALVFLYKIRKAKQQAIDFFSDLEYTDK